MLLLSSDAERLPSVLVKVETPSKPGALFPPGKNLDARMIVWYHKISVD